MRYLLAGCMVLGIGFQLSAQKFKTYHAFGFGAGLNSSCLKTKYENPSMMLLPDLGDQSIRLDIYGSYDLGLIRWLGIGSGIGLSIRGGATENRSTTEKKRRDLYYLNVPLRLQLKPFRFLWIEPGVESMILLGHTDVGYDTPWGTDEPFDNEDLEFYTISGYLGLRINVFKGLSLNAAVSSGLTSVAEAEGSVPGVSATYADFTYSVGVRYMLNQPD